MSTYGVKMYFLFTDSEIVWFLGWHGMCSQAYSTSCSFLLRAIPKERKLLDHDGTILRASFGDLVLAKPETETKAT